MFINIKDAAVVIILVLFGSISLTYGEALFDWSELIRGNIFTFFITIAVLYTSISFDRWHKQRQDDLKRMGILKGIYQEIIERARYLKNYAKICINNQTPYIICMNKYSASAWQSAINEGYFDPEDQFWTDCEYIYQSTDQLNYEMDRANSIYYQSTIEKEIVITQLYSMSANWIKLIERTLIIIDSIILEIEKKLGISHGQMLKLNSELTNRIDQTIKERMQYAKETAVQQGK